MPVDEAMVKNSAELDRFAVGVLPITKLRTRIGAPGPVMKIWFEPNDMLTSWPGVPMPANRAGCDVVPIKVTPPVLVRVPFGARTTVPAVPPLKTCPNRRSSTLINSSGRTMATCASAAVWSAWAGLATTSADKTPAQAAARKNDDFAPFTQFLSH